MRTTVTVGLHAEPKIRPAEPRRIYAKELTIDTGFLHKPVDVIIVGGSIGGLCTALALSKIGCRVSIYEKLSSADDKGAGILVQPDLKDFISFFSVDDPASTYLSTSRRQTLNRSGIVIDVEEQQQSFTAWKTLHRVLRRSLPRSVSLFAGNPIAAICKVEHGNAVQVKPTEGDWRGADLVVFADGPASLGRRFFLPGYESSYSGYVAWRGVIPEQDLPTHVVQQLADCFTMYQGPGMQLVCYPIPGEDGSMEKGKRLLNWVWYCCVTDHQLTDVLTDKEGVVHKYGVSKGYVRPELVTAQQAHAQRTLPPSCATMIAATSTLFLQGIFDGVACECAWDNAVLLGDAAALCRPHPGLGTTKAAVNAVALANALLRHRGEVSTALQQWQVEQMAVGKELHELSVTIGQNVVQHATWGQDEDTHSNT